MYPAAFAGKPGCWRARSEAGHLSGAAGIWGGTARHGAPRTGQQRLRGVEAQRTPLAGIKSERRRFWPGLFQMSPLPTNFSVPSFRCAGTTTFKIPQPFNIGIRGAVIPSKYKNSVLGLVQKAPAPATLREVGLD